MYRFVKKKNIYLSLALVVPVLVFVFLKFFGTNKFQIPIFHQFRIEEVSGCRHEFKTPYVVEDSVIRFLTGKQGETILVVFINLQGENKLRIDKEAVEGRLKIVDMTAGAISQEKLKDIGCTLLKPVTDNAVLIDAKKQIRGYYNLGNREEMDRLQVELKILFNEY
jgi:hypothetical protein